MGEVARSHRRRSARQGARGTRAMSPLPDAGDGMPAAHLEPPVGEGPLERICKWASEAALIVMLVVIGADIFTRYLLNFSFEIADELGGYMLVVMTFVMLWVFAADFSPRYLLNFSFESADELGGYMLVVMPFVSL